MRISCITLFAILIASAANAQSIQGNQPYTACATHDGIDTTGYQLKINSVAVASTSASALANGEICFTAVAPNTRQTIQVIISAFNQDGESDSDPLAVQVIKGKPAKPGKPRIASGAISAVKGWAESMVASNK